MKFAFYAIFKQNYAVAICLSIRNYSEPRKK